MLALGFTLSAAPALAAEPGTVATQATARASVPNTVADVTLRIEAHGRTVAEVQSALAANSGTLKSYLAEAKARNAATSVLDVSPDLDPKPAAGRAPGIVGYTGHLAVTFQLDADQLGVVVANALGHGANSVENTALHPARAAIDAERQRLAAAATRLAVDQARNVAEAAGRQLGAVRSITVQEDDGVPLRVFRAAMPTGLAAPAPAAAPIATEAGETELTANVAVTIELIEPGPAPH